MKTTVRILLVVAILLVACVLTVLAGPWIVATISNQPVEKGLFVDSLFD